MIASPPRLASDDPAGPVGRVLVVDDDPVGLRAIAEALRDQGHEVREAGDGPVALALLEGHVPDVVVLDVLMAGMSGIQVCREIRSRYARLDLPVIFLTGLADEASRMQCWRAGGNDFVSRPVSAPELLLRVGNLMQLRQHHALIAQRALELEATVAERTAALRESQEEAIFRLATAVELRDGITAKHGVRVGGLAGRIAARMGMPPERCDELKLAAAMHDVGKVAIPDRILMKEGSLTPVEYAEMKGHALIGERLIGGASSRLLSLAATVAGSHHERLDGSGYPRGLAGDAIPLPGRITAVADVFDATTTARLYRYPMPIERSLGILEAGRGTLFDPDVLDAFLVCLADRSSPETS